MNDIPKNYCFPKVSQLSFEQKIAQILGLPIFVKTFTKNYVGFEKFVQRYGIGHIHLSYGDAKQMFSSIEYIQKLVFDGCGIPVFFGADCEQGLRHSFDFGTELPWQMAIGATEKEKYAYCAGMVTGKEARMFGIDMIYGPVADVITNSQNTVIMNRSFGGNSAQVSKFVANYVQGCQSQGVLATLKHFPGHGNALEDSHLELPVDNSNLEYILQHHLPPFIAGIQTGAKAIMTGHVVFPFLNRDFPATVSSEIMYDILRKKLGFKGLVITDSMNMWAIRKFLPKSREEYGVQAIASGCDIILHPGKFERMSDHFKQGLDQGTITEDAINQAVSHVLEAKGWLRDQQSVNSSDRNPLFQEEHQKIADDIANDSITLLPSNSDEPCFGHQPLPNDIYDILCISDTNRHRITVASVFTDMILQANPKSRLYQVEEDVPQKGWEDIEEMKASNHPVILVVLCPMMWFKGRSLLPEALSKKVWEFLENRNVLVTVIFGSPHIAKQLPGKLRYCGYGPSIVSQEATAKVILGQHPPNGKLPINFL